MTITPAPSTELLQDVDLSSPEGCDHAMQLMTRTTFEVYCRIAHAYIYKYEHGTKEEFCERYGKSKRTLQKYEKRMRELKLIASEPPRGIHAIRAEKGASVENIEAIDVKVIEEKKEQKSMTEEEAATFNDLVDLCEEQQQEINRLTANANLVIDPNVRLQQRPEPESKSLSTTKQFEGGIVIRTDTFIPEHIDDPEAHEAAQTIITLLDEAAELCRQWHSSRRISNELWDSIEGHAGIITTYGRSRVSDTEDAAASAIDIDGTVIPSDE